MRGFIRTTALLLVIGLAGCGGSGTIATIGSPQALMFVIGTGTNNIQGFQTTTIGQIEALTVPATPTNPIPVSLALTPSRAFLYVANSTSNTVSGFTVNHTTGVLTPVGSAILPTPVCSTPSTCNFNPLGVAVDSSGQFLFVLNQGSVSPLVAPSISVFSIDGTRGLLTEIGGSPFAAPASPEFIAASPTSEFVYVSSSSGTISPFSIASNGTLSAVSPFSSAGSDFRGMIIDPQGKFLYATDHANNQVASFSIQSSGALSLVGSPAAAGTQPVAAAIDSTGTFLYVANQGSNNVSAYKTSSGALTQVSGSPFATAGSGVITATQPVFLVIDPTNAFLFVADTGSKDIAAFNIKSADGTLTMVTNSPFGQTLAPTWLVSTR